MIVRVMEEEPTLEAENAKINAKIRKKRDTPSIMALQIIAKMMNQMISVDHRTTRKVNVVSIKEKIAAVVAKQK